MKKFRLLNADEIECRVASVKDNGLSLLLYKDARCDMNILDETVGPFNWERYHSRDNANCVVSIWDEEKRSWVSKEDTGTDSYTEAEKGRASDSFKRACFNWGIGRELYTAPFIWIAAKNYKPAQKNGKPTTYDNFVVTEIEYTNDERIESLKIVNTSMDGKPVVFNWKAGKPAGSKPKAKAPADDSKLATLKAEIERTGTNAKAMTEHYGVLTLEDIANGSMYDDAIEILKGKPNKK